MTLGPVTKPDKRNKTTSKKFDYDIDDGLNLNLTISSSFEIGNLRVSDAINNG